MTGSHQSSASETEPGGADLTVVAPCFNEAETLPVFLEELVPALEEITGGRWNLLLVDDGSTDATASIIADRHGDDERITGVFLSRNFGHQAALTAGLAYASGETIAVMDCDLQDPVEVLVEMVGKVREEGFDVCLGVRGKREAPLPLRICYPLFYRLISRFSDHDWPMDAGDFCVFNRRVHRTLLALPERDRMLRGLRSWVGFRQTAIEYERPARRHGVSKYNVFKLVGLALKAFVGFSSFPLRMASVLGFFMSLLTLGVGLLFLLNRLFPEFSVLGYYIGANPGITTLALYLSLISGMLFFCLGIIGEYLGLIVRETKRRPAAIVARTVGLGSLAGEERVVLSATDALP